MNLGALKKGVSKAIWPGSLVVAVPAGLVIGLKLPMVDSYERYGQALASRASVICEHGNSSKLGDQLAVYSAVRGAQREAGVAPPLPRARVPDYFICEDGRKIEILGDRNFSRDAFRADDFES